MISRTPHTASFVVAALLACSASHLVASEEESTPKSASKFIRIQRNADGAPLALETSIASYKPGEKQNPGLQVDLIGAVHVADKSYYDQLNQLFSTYDVVLYELVAERGAVPRPGQRSANPVSAMQVGMKRMLELEFQLDRIDYSRKNLRHADLTPVEFAQSMRDRGESVMSIFFRMLGQSIAQQSRDPAGNSDARLLVALFSRDRALQLKQIMAEQFEDMSAATSVLDGPKGSTILTERNKRAMQVLKSSIDSGKRRIGIFYGAAHLPDMEKRLRDEFGLQPSSHRWLTAWSLQKPTGDK